MIYYNIIYQNYQKNKSYNIKIFYSYILIWAQKDQENAEYNERQRVQTRGTWDKD